LNRGQKREDTARFITFEKWMIRIWKTILKYEQKARRDRKISEELNRSVIKFGGGTGP
jgi:hypothetical protein